jgi:hypothetical protein
MADERTNLSDGVILEVLTIEEMEEVVAPGIMVIGE